jgi:hypothetical protein
MKRRLRLSTDRFDDDISSYITAAKMELSRAGGQVSEDVEIVQVAIEMYLKAMFNYEAEGERYMLAFEGMRDAIALTGSDFF